MPDFSRDPIGAAPPLSTQTSASAISEAPDPDIRLEALPVELTFLSIYGASSDVLIGAVLQARAQGVSPDAALLASGAMSESFFYRSLAHYLGVIFLDGEARLGPGARYPHCIYAGMAPLAGDLGPEWLLAPRGAALVELVLRTRRSELPPARIAITTPSHLSQLVRAASAARMARDASFALANLDSSLSAREGLSRAQQRILLAAIWTVGFFCALAPPFGSTVLSLSLNTLFLATIFLRLFTGAASLDEAEQPPPRTRIDDRRLPVYSIIVALHHEARVVPQLIAALDSIDYPCGKLDIKLVIERDDRATRLALEALSLAPIYEIIVAPPGWPKTKPRALNIALPLLRGKFVTVFDAEDAPAPLQLREAAEKFLRSRRQLACLQARLAIDNIEDSWLTRLFAIEYATLFDVLHQGMAKLQIPVPLGGSSNHFRTEVLREICGWDAWNVTEDADLGMRLARFGTLAASTQEEAPAGFRAWLRQRRRWSKGWMQTFITLSRDPCRLISEIGLADAVALGLMLTALVIAPPLWPFFAAFVIYDVAEHGFPIPDSGVALLEATLWISVALFGSASTLWLTTLGMKRRKLLGLWPFLPLLLPYHLLISLSSWLAVCDLILRPFHWHKTEHGLAKSSRQNDLTLAARSAKARFDLERDPANLTAVPR